MTINNPQLDVNILHQLKQKILNNSATAEDYETLDFFLSSIGFKNYILNKLIQNGINSYQEFIDERKKPLGQKNTTVDGVLLGNILGTIPVLLNFIK